MLLGFDQSVFLGIENNRVPEIAYSRGFMYVEHILNLTPENSIYCLQLSIFTHLRREMRINC